MFPFPQLLFCYISKEEDTYFHVIILPSLTCDAEGGIVINLIYILEHFEVLFQRQSRQVQVTEEKRKKKKSWQFQWRVKQVSFRSNYPHTSSKSSNTLNTFYFSLSLISYLIINHIISTFVFFFFFSLPKCLIA